jgi:hypothetical protein
MEEQVVAQFGEVQETEAAEAEEAVAPLAELETEAPEEATQAAEAATPVDLAAESATEAQAAEAVFEESPVVEPPAEDARISLDEMETELPLHVSEPGLESEPSAEPAQALEEQVSEAELVQEQVCPPREEAVVEEALTEEETESAEEEAPEEAASLAEEPPATAASVIAEQEPGPRPWPQEPARPAAAASAPMEIAARVAAPRVRQFPVQPAPSHRGSMVDALRAWGGMQQEQEQTTPSPAMPAPAPASLPEEHAAAAPPTLSDPKKDKSGKTVMVDSLMRFMGTR